jgi:peroxin-3
MALVPTLGQQILAEMDVEGVTAELQTKSRASRPHVPSVLDESSLASSIDVLQDHEGRSDAGSVSVSSFSGSGRESNTGEASPTWVDQFSPKLDGQPRRPSTESGPIPLELASSGLSHATNLSESISTTNSALSYGPDGSGRVRISTSF